MESPAIAGLFLCTLATIEKVLTAEYEKHIHRLVFFIGGSLHT